jgi:hypothetical protein
MTGPFGHGIDRMGHGHWPLGQVMGIDRSQKDSWQKDDRVMHDRPLRSGQVTITPIGGHGIGHGIGHGHWVYDRVMRSRSSQYWLKRRCYK